MAMETLGKASTSENFAEIEGLVAFEFSYGQREYSIALSDEEMDTILLSGMQKLLSNRHLPESEYMIVLESPDLPLFVGAKSIEMSTPRGRGEISMGVGIITQSVVDELEQRGTLTAERSWLTGEWEDASYVADPPLAQHPAARQ